MNSTHINAARTWLDRALELSWLAAIIVVPLITLPADDFITLMGLPKTVVLRVIASIAVFAWVGIGVVRVTEWALFERPVTEAAGAGRHMLSGLDRPSKWVFWSVAGLALATTFSTLLSIDPAVSVWGKRAAYEGYGLYSSLSLLALFVTVALRLKTRPQLWRALGAVALVGTVSALIGIAQGFDMWPVMDRLYPDRVSGHAGNPIAYGSLLLLVFPVALAVTILWGMRKPSFTRFWLPVFGVNFVFMYAVGLTLSRGPYLGMAVAAVALPVLLGMFVGWRFALRLAAVSLLSVLIVAGLLVIGDRSFGSLDSADGAETDVSERVTDDTTVSYRLETWRASRDLLLDRPDVPGASGPGVRVIRDLFGYGPDQFRYVIGLTTNDEAFSRTTSEAHNDLINRAVESGFAGLAAFTAVLVTAALSLALLLRRSRVSGDFTLTLLAAAVLSALAGRMVEQQFGIARNADLVVFWVLLGIVVALPRVVALEAPQVSTGKRAAQRRSSSRLATLPHPRIATAFTLAIAVAVFAVIGLTAFTWQRNVNYLFADHEARVARDLRAIQPEEALDRYEKATSLAPDVTRYQVEMGDYYGALAESTLNQSQQMSLLKANYEADLAALKINELERDTNFQLAESAWRLALAGDTAKAQVALDRYEFLIEIAPRYSLAHERLAQLEKAVSVSAD